MPVSLQELILKGLEKNPEKRITVPMMMVSEEIKHYNILNILDFLIKL